MSRKDDNNSRGLIRSMLVIGVSQLVVVTSSLVRMKVLALLLGPAGIGLLGILSNLQQLVGKGFGLGIASSGVRTISINKADFHKQRLIANTVILANFIQGSLAFIPLWLYRDKISVFLTGTQENKLNIVLVGVAVIFLLLSVSHTSILQALKQVKSFSKATVFGAVGGTFLGLTVVSLFGSIGLVSFLIFQPALTLFASRYFLSKNSKYLFESKCPNFKEATVQWKSLVGLGAAFMVGGLSSVATLLIVRTMLTQNLGIDAAGYFAAAWGITVTYVGFLLSAMGTDYYPRLASVIEDKIESNKLINTQWQLGLAIGGPTMIFLIGSAPWVVNILYSSDFSSSVEIIQWQSVGNIFKLASWALSFAIAAASRSKLFLLIELTFSSVFIIFTWFLLPIIGIKSIGLAFLFGYICYFLLVLFLVVKLNSFKPEKLSQSLLLIQVCLSLLALFVSLNYPIAGLFLTLFLSTGSVLYGTRVVLIRTGAEGKVPKKLYGAFSAIGWPINKGGN